MEKKYPIWEVRIYFVFKHPKTGEKLSSKLYTPLELLDTDLSIINERTCVCDCKPVGETNVVECNCYEYYQDFEFHSYQVELAQPPAEAERGKVSDDAHEKEAMMKGFEEVQKIFEARAWIMEGRGSYAYNDDRYKQEVRYLYDEFEAIRKNTWAQVRSKSIEYRQQIIEQYLKENPPTGAVWVKASDRPLVNKNDDFGWICTEDGEKDFIAAVPYFDKRHPGKTFWWIHHCVIENGSLFIVGEEGNEPAGWDIDSIAYWMAWPGNPGESGLSQPEEVP